MAIKRIAYLGLPNCLRLSNDQVEVVVTTDVGPRVVRYAMLGGENVFGERPQDGIITDLGEWKPWGGHRLWSAPEEMPASYVPDNQPLERVDEADGSVDLVQRVDRYTSLQKSLRLTLSAEGSGVNVMHRITNRGGSAVTIAAWGLTIMRGGGTALLPQEPFGPHPEFLRPARPVVMWHYTDLADPRVSFGRRFIRVRADDRLAAAQKIGIGNKQGWAAYHVESTVFVKRFTYDEGATYPDYGANNEVFTAASLIELESLSPLRHLAPDEAVLHEERWSLFDGVPPTAEADDEAALGTLGPLIGD
jgi:hypothetical protein